MRAPLLLFCLTQSVTVLWLPLLFTACSCCWQGIYKFSHVRMGAMMNQSLSLSQPTIKAGGAMPTVISST